MADLRNRSGGPETLNIRRIRDVSTLELNTRDARRLVRMNWMMVSCIQRSLVEGCHESS